MNLYKKRDGKWSEPFLQGRYKKNVIKIRTQRNGKYYYFIDGDISYNSLWGNEEYASVEEASEAAQNHIDMVKA